MRLLTLSPHAHFLQLFTWLPKADLLISKGHKVIVATLNSDEVHLQAIKDTAQAAQLNIEPLDVQDRTEMCVVSRNLFLLHFLI